MANTVSIKAFLDKEKLRPIECGFIPAINRRVPFSAQFFLVALIFLVFDIELILLFPVLLVLRKSMRAHRAQAFMVLVVLLNAGLFLEWSQKILEWYS